MVAIVGGGGWMFVKGLHLEDIQQILVASTGSPPPATGRFNQPPPTGGPAALPQPWAPDTNGTIKIASFNIQVFGNAKASKPHVIDTLAQIVSRFDVIAIQEIRTQDDHFMTKFVTRIYQLTGRRYDSRVGPRLGNTRSTEQYAFLFDVDRIEVSPSQVYTITDTDNLLHREPMVAMFRVRGVPENREFTFVLINTHTDPDVADDEMDALAKVYSVVRRQWIGSEQEDDVILLGDFNTAIPAATSGSLGRRGRSLTPQDLFGLGQIPGIYPVVRSEPTNVIRNKIHDNILFHHPSTTEFTGQGGVYDIGALHGLTLDQVKQVSDHLPVWAEFRVYESGMPGRMANRPPLPVSPPR